MTKEDLNTYAMKVTQASRSGLIVLIYEIAAAYIDDALKAHAAGDIEEFRESLRKARGFISELASSLDMKYEISARLLGIYLFMNRTLNMDDIKGVTKDLDRIRDMLLKLRGAFETVSKSDNSGPVMENAQKVYEGLTYGKDSSANTYTDTAGRGYKA